MLSRASQPVHLTPKAFELLELLLARRPRAISKPALMELLWPGVVVTEGSLANIVSEVRIAIGDTARCAHFIRTEGDNLIGRGEDCRLRIRSSTVSRHHARVLVRGDRVVLEDLGSKNGTYVFGRRVLAPTALQGGEEIQVGSITLRFSAFPDRSSTDTFSLRSRSAH